LIISEIMEAFLVTLNVTRFALYIQDFGAPVGLRIASRHPEWVSALIVQNGNAYVEGISAAFEAFQPFWQNRNAETEMPLRGFLALNTTQFQYTHGARHVEAISPDTWTHDQALLDRPGNDLIQLALMHDYQNNPPQYTVWQDYFCKHQPPTLITWGKNDPFLPKTERALTSSTCRRPSCIYSIADTSRLRKTSISSADSSPGSSASKVDRPIPAPHRAMAVPFNAKSWPVPNHGRKHHPYSFTFLAAWRT